MAVSRFKALPISTILVCQLNRIQVMVMVLVTS
jgi:hypothetical protein